MPNAIDAVADFTGTAIAGSLTVTLDGNQTIGTLTIPAENNKTLTIAAGTPAGFDAHPANEHRHCTHPGSIAGTANNQSGDLRRPRRGNPGFPASPTPAPSTLTGANTLTGTIVPYRSGLLILDRR